MSNPKVLKPESELSIFAPEISARRVAILLSLFSKQKEDFLIGNPIKHIVSDEIFKRILGDSNFWISIDIEFQIINYLSTLSDISNILFHSGRESFLAGAYDLLPNDDTQISFLEMIVKIPILAGKFSRVFWLNPKIHSENSCTYEFDYLGGNKERWYDILYMKGILEGAAILFQVSNCSIELLETRLSGILIDHSELGKNIKFGANKNYMKISWKESPTKVGKTNLDKELKLIQPKTFFISTIDEAEKEKFSFVDLSTVLEKSRQLMIDNRELETIVEVLNNLKIELETKQKSFTKDLRMARNIQRGIIPQRIPDWKGLQFWVKFFPLQEVSGDYYDYFNFGSNKIGLLVSDVSGHGVPAAFITAISKLLFSQHKLDSPSEIFSIVNRELLELVKQQGYLTSFYALINSDYEVLYSIAGHPRPILAKYKTKEVILLEGEGTYLGMFPDAREFYKDYKIKLEPGDKLYIYTDGIIEGQNVDGERFEIERLISSIQDSIEMGVKESTEYIISKFNHFCRGTDPSDDQTLLAIGVSPHLDEYKLYVQTAEKFYRNKNYSEACKNLIKANEILPRDLWTLFSLGKYFAKNKEYENAIRFLDEYNNLKTYNADAFLIQGYCYYKLGNYEKAEESLQSSISLRAENIPAMYNLSKTQVKLSKINEAKNTLQKILVIKEDFEPAINLLKKI
ncbi:MAG: SpoIIE family protein phosphatase [Leptospiraceae bacterium]|nr:SpoIIE family protein phosphatase [Leptospiraceae bacterium]NUM42231.1 SpoIIE family protein phosphatase [Leptospiraceae bacterium]